MSHEVYAPPSIRTVRKSQVVIWIIISFNSSHAECWLLVIFVVLQTCNIYLTKFSTSTQMSKSRVPNYRDNPSPICFEAIVPPVPITKIFFMSVLLFDTRIRQNSVKLPYLHTRFGILLNPSGVSSLIYIEPSGLMSLLSLCFVIQNHVWAGGFGLKKYQFPILSMVCIWPSVSVKEVPSCIVRIMMPS